MSSLPVVAITTAPDESKHNDLIAIDTENNQIWLGPDGVITDDGDETILVEFAGSKAWITPSGPSINGVSVFNQVRELAEKPRGTKIAFV